MLDKVITKVGAKKFAALAAAGAVSLYALGAAIERHFAQRKAYDKGRADEREIWKEQVKIWKKKAKELARNNIFLWEKYKEICRLLKKF